MIGPHAAAIIRQQRTVSFSNLEYRSLRRSSRTTQLLHRSQGCMSAKCSFADTTPAIVRTAPTCSNVQRIVLQVNTPAARINAHDRLILNATTVRQLAVSTIGCHVLESREKLRGEVWQQL